MAAQERVTITQRTLAGKKEKASHEGFAGGPAPLGYARDKDGGLQVVAEEAEVVRRIYTLRKQGHTLQEIANILNAEGVPTKHGGSWYPGTVRYILDNPKYEGYVEYCFRWDGEQYVIKKGQHQAILPKVSKPVKKDGASRTRHRAGSLLPEGTSVMGWSSTAFTRLPSLYQMIQNRNFARARDGCRSTALLARIFDYPL